ncbi:MAG: hypothetical protein P8Y54_14860 [Xanthomonadales bacterium]
MISSGFPKRLPVTLFLVLFGIGAHAGDPAEIPAGIANASYAGTAYGVVTLTDGVWEGAPWVEGGAARPRVGLARDFIRYGDVDGDGDDEALVIVWQSSGGSGTFNYVALVDRSDGDWRNVATTALGDRVKVTDAAIGPDGVTVDVIEHDEDDPACCPTRATTRRYDANLDEFNETDHENR